MVTRAESGERVEPEYGQLPELARTLRGLGSARRGAGTLQAQFFRPLLDARRRAMEARTPAARVHAFDVALLQLGLERWIERAVSHWPDARAPVRRAVHAQLSDRLAAYRESLAELDTAAHAAARAGVGERLAAWRAWTAQLQVTFQCADRGWLAVQPVVQLPNARKSESAARKP